MLAILTESDSWTWVGRISSVVTLLGIFSIALYLWRSLRKFVRKPRGIITLFPPSGRFTGLIVPVSATFPNPREDPNAILARIRGSEGVDEEMRNGPIGIILKAIEHHHASLQHCWLVGSAESEPYLPAIKEACTKYFRNVTLHDLIKVDEVYGAIDDVYNAVHRIFDECEMKTGGVVTPDRIVTDVTGGTKIMSIGLALACLDANRQIEYIDQKDRKTFYAVDITWEKIARRPAPVNARS
jgi:hypothetical protein